MKVLFIVPYAPNLVRVRSYNLIRNLSERGHQVTVASLWSNAAERGDLEALREHCYEVIARPWSRRDSYKQCLKVLFGRAPFQSVYSWNEALFTDICAQLSAFDVVHVEHLRGARYAVELHHYMRKNGLRIPIVWDSVDCISLLFRQAVKQLRWGVRRAFFTAELQRTVLYEQWLLQPFDRILVTSRADRQALIDLTDNNVSPTPITVLSNGVVLDDLSVENGQVRQPRSLIITGKMSYHANAAMAQYAVYEIMPRIWAQTPDVKLTIAGRSPTDAVVELAQNPGVRVTGEVPDLRPYLREASIAIAPIVYGVGVQNKVLEAMACGTPVVVFPQAISALQVEPGQDVVVATTAEEFAQNVLALLQDSERQQFIGKNGRTYVETHHQWESIVEQLEGIYDEVIHSTRTE